MDPLNWRPDWIFAITTLLIRFIGIFVVLAILQIAMQVSGYIFKHLAEKRALKDTLGPSVAGPSETVPLGEEVDEQEIAAAIGAALSLYESEAAITLPMGEGSPSRPSNWTIMGRISQLQSRVAQGWH